MVKRTINRALSITTAFIVFGFVDNFFMILFGDRIDTVLIEIGITNTLFAAGLGNTLSDAVGIFLGRRIEKTVHKKLSPLKGPEPSEALVLAAETLGIVIGCLIGLCPLIFI